MNLNTCEIKVFSADPFKNRQITSRRSTREGRYFGAHASLVSLTVMRMLEGGGLALSQFVDWASVYEKQERRYEPVPGAAAAVS